MPKQIILEYPWKAILLGSSYDIYHYDTIDNPIFIYNGISIIKADSGEQLSLSLNPKGKNSLPLLSVLTQCQTELNNQL
jgi:hypothetical protein